MINSRRSRRFHVLVLFALVFAAVMPALVAAHPSSKKDKSTRSEQEVVALLDKIAASGVPEVEWAKLSNAQKKQVLDYLNPDFHKQGKRGELVGLSFVPATAPTEDSFHVQAGTGYYLTNIRKIGSITTKGPYVRGKAPACCSATLTMNNSQSLSASWSANVGVSAEVVSAGVGFNVTATWQQNYSYSITHPAGTTYQIDAYNKFDIIGYDVWYDPWVGYDYKAGYGDARKFMGVYYSAWRVS
jgi:hypothetical protein